MNYEPIAIKNLRTSLATIADEVELNNKSFQVFRRSKPSFKIVPVNSEIEEWETVLDFTQENGQGVDIDVVLNKLTV